ncbi:MAG: hypothetical protein M1333_02775 [Patescibacteria group bacterium]|nr:hypothetical protein [Patescibacteria group bacterium]
MNNISKQISVIGQKMMADKNWQQFSDIDYNPEKGIIARCLYYEENGRKGKSVIIVGMNPGRAKPEETNYFKNKENRNYPAGVRYWEQNRKDYINFYGPLRDLADKADLTGPILWTELVKCQSRKNAKALSLNTIRYSISNYLCKEIAAMPDNTPLIAVGNHAFELLAYVYPNRKIIGIPHPSKGNFGYHYAYQKGKVISSQLIQLIKQHLKNGNNNAVQSSYNKSQKKFVIKK